MIRERQHVLAALAQGRNADLDDVQAVVEILPEASGAYLCGEIPVRRRDQAHVDVDVVVVAHRPDAALLDGAQELHLDVERQLADLVEEERSEEHTSELQSLAYLVCRLL